MSVVAEGAALGGRRVRSSAPGHARAVWQKRAGVVAAHREATGWTDESRAPGAGRKPAHARLPEQPTAAELEAAVAASSLAVTIANDRASAEAAQDDDAPEDRADLDDSDRQRREDADEIHALHTPASTSENVWAASDTSAVLFPGGRPGQQTSAYHLGNDSTAMASTQHKRETPPSSIWPATCPRHCWRACSASTSASPSPGNAPPPPTGPPTPQTSPAARLHSPE